MKHDYTPTQLAILHKLTNFKYCPTAANLITAEEYNSLTTFLKGYAHCLQSDFEGSMIPKNRIKSIDFYEGAEQARKEIGPILNLISQFTAPKYFLQ